MDISYSLHGRSDLDLVTPLWEELNGYHKKRSIYFKGYYSGMSFEKRKKTLLEKTDEGSLRLLIASDKNSGDKAGYCISSVSNERGEIDSLYVKEEYRRKGIGDHLIRDAVAWFNCEHVDTRTVSVSFGNDKGLGFYGRYGFMPRYFLLEQVRKAPKPASL